MPKSKNSETKSRKKNSSNISLKDAGYSVMDANDPYRQMVLQKAIRQFGGRKVLNALLRLSGLNKNKEIYYDRINTDFKNMTGLSIKEWKARGKKIPTDEVLEKYSK